MNEIIINKSILEEAKIRSGKYKKNVLVGFSDVISLDQICEYLACKEAGGIPVFLSHISEKTDEILFSKRKENWERLGIKNYYPNIKDNGQEIENDGVSFVQLSSGTTSSQKGFGVRESTLNAQLEYYKNKADITKNSVIISWLPLYHDMGLITSLYLPLYVGCKSVIIPTFDWVKNPGLFFESIQKHGGTHAWIPNFCFELFLKDSYILTNQDFHFINCSETCRESTVKRFKQMYPCKVSSCYAMAENVFAVSQSGADDLESFNGVLNCGTPDGAQVKISQSGEISISGKCLFDFSLVDGRFEPAPSEYSTGDIGEIVDKKLYILGRSMEILKVKGEKIFLPDLEKEINDSCDVIKGRVVAFGVESRGTEELVVLYESFDYIDKEIRRVIHKNFQIPSKVFRVPQGFILKTSSGKISRKENNERYKKFYFLKGVVSDYSEEKIDFFTELKSEGILDSFSLMEVLLKTSVKLNKQINWNNNFNIDSVHSFLEIL